MLLNYFAKNLYIVFVKFYSKMYDNLAKLKLVRIGNPVSVGGLERLGEKAIKASNNVVKSYKIIQYDKSFFETEGIEARILTDALNEEIGGHILGVIEMDLFDSDGDSFYGCMFGAKNLKNNVAVVSTKRVFTQDSDMLSERVIKIALHELGHNLGLKHHYNYMGLENGLLCPMAKGNYNKYGERGYVLAIIDSRGYEFCEDCKKVLRVYNSISNQLSK